MVIEEIEKRLAQLAQLGVEIDSRESLEKLAKAKFVVIDKTGTLTEGKPEVATAVCFDLTKQDRQEGDKQREQRDRMIAMVAALEMRSSHPLALAAVRYGRKLAQRSKKVKSYFNQFDVVNVKEVAGRGVSGLINGIEVLVGRPQWIKDRGFAVERVEKKIEVLEKEGQTVVLVVIGRIVGMIGMRDKLKAESRETIRIIKKTGVKIWIITGDNRRTAEAIANKLGIKESRVMAGVMPNEKAKQIGIIQEATREMVVMVGDGVNDAPALKQADVGIAFFAEGIFEKGAVEIIIKGNDLALVGKVFNWRNRE